MPPALQAKLLRALEAGEVRRIGENETRRVDVRFVAATNADLQAAVDRGDFRSDLSTASTCTASTCRRCASAVTTSARCFEYFSRAFGGAHASPASRRRRARRCSPSTIPATSASSSTSSSAPWPWRAASSSSRRSAGGARRARATPRAPPRGTVAAARERAEREMIVATLARNHGEVSATARELQVSRTTLWRLMKKHRIPLTVRLHSARRSRSCFSLKHAPFQRRNPQRPGLPLVLDSLSNSRLSRQRPCADSARLLLLTVSSAGCRRLRPHDGHTCFTADRRRRSRPRAHARGRGGCARVPRRRAVATRAERARADQARRVRRAARRSDARRRLGLRADPRSSSGRRTRKSSSCRSGRRWPRPSSGSSSRRSRSCRSPTSASCSRRSSARSSAARMTCRTGGWSGSCSRSTRSRRASRARSSSTDILTGALQRLVRAMDAVGASIRLRDRLTDRFEDAR